jgi:hypothetical protein
MKGLRVKVLAVSIALVAVLTVGLTSSSATLSKHHKLITTKQIANGAITGPKIRNGAVSTKKLAGGAVTASKINSAFLSTLVVNNPSSTQTITYGGAGVGTILGMASGATADPLAIQNSGGTSVFSVGTDGSVTSGGNLTADGSLSTDGGEVTSDGVGDLTVGGTLTSDGGAVSTSGFGDLTISGQLSTDNGGVTTDGSGDLSVSGSLSSDNGDISSDGSGNLTVSGDFSGFGTVNAEGSDFLGNALNVDGGGVSVTGTNNDGNYLDLGGGALTVDSNGDLTVTGAIIDANLPTSDPGVAGELWQNCSVSDPQGGTLDGCFVEVSQGP